MNYTKPEIPVRECVNCHNTFQPEDVNQNLCSDACASSHISYETGCLAANYDCEKSIPARSYWIRRANARSFRFTIWGGS